MNNPYILSVYDCGKTALGLRNYLREKTGKRWLYRKVAENYAPIIRWGNSQQTFINDTIYNKPEYIATCSHKLRLSKLLHENKIPVINFHTSTPERYPIFIRTLINGQGGKGIVIAKSYEEWLPYRGKYYSYYMMFEHEVRVHMLGGKAIKVLKKELIEGAVEDDIPIRNNDNKYHYRLKNIKYKPYEKAFELAERIYKIFPINMVGFDMGYDGRNYYVIEGNSAPSLNSVNLPIYGDYILSIL